MSGTLVGWVFQNSPYKGPFLLIHLAIADTVDDERLELKVSQRWLADKARVSRNTVGRFFDRALRDGVLEPMGTIHNRAMDVRLVAHGYATGGSRLSHQWPTGGSQVAQTVRDTTPTPVVIKASSELQQQWLTSKPPPDPAVLERIRSFRLKQVDE